MVAFFAAATTLIIAQCDFNNLQICTSFLHINMFCVIVTNDEKMELFRYIFPPGADLDFYKILQEKLRNFKLVILLLLRSGMAKSNICNTTIPNLALGLGTYIHFKNYNRKFWFKFLMNGLFCQRPMSTKVCINSFNFL